MTHTDDLTRSKNIDLIEQTMKELYELIEEYGARERNKKETSGSRVADIESAEGD